MNLNIDVGLMHSLFEYKDGALLEKTKRSVNTVIGSKAGTITKKGYRQVVVGGKAYLEHRIIYAMLHGADNPETEIDHIDKNKANNCIDNLRLATRSENMCNRDRPLSNNKLGALGVCFMKSRAHLPTPYQASIRLSGKTIYLGVFSTIELASQAYQLARKQYFGEFA